MSLDYSKPWHPRSWPASPVRCRGCERPFQAGHVPTGDPLCSECSHRPADLDDDAQLELGL